MKKSLKILLLNTALLTGLSLVGCGKNNEENTSSTSPITTDSPSISSSDSGSETSSVENVYTLSLQVSEYDLVVGEDVTLRATLKLNGQTVEDTITWTSSDPTVATVENGKVTALKSGETEITASSNGQSAKCTITVTDDVQLSFAKESMVVPSDEDALVELALTKNGVAGSISDVNLSVADESLFDVSVVEGKIKVSPKGKAGTTTLKASFEGEEETMRIEVYKSIRSVKDFQNISKDLTANYILMYDLDFANFNFTTIMHYDQSNNGAKGFAGTLEGNGHTLSNIDLTPVAPYTNSTSVFGVILKNGVVRNLALDNVHGSNLWYSGSIAGINFGLIENCKVSIGEANGTNPYTFGGIASQNKNSGIIRNCIVDTTNATLPSIFGGIAARQYTQSPKIENCYVIGAETTKIVVENQIENGIVNTKVVANYAALAAEDLSEWSSIWSVDETKVALVNDGKKADFLSGGFTEEEYEIDTSETLNLNQALVVLVNGEEGEYTSSYTFNENAFTLENGILTPKGITLEPETISVVATTSKGGYFEASATISVTDSSGVVVTVDKAALSFEFTQGQADPMPSYTLVVNATQEGNPSYNPEIILTSSNEDVATVSGFTVTAVDEGNATIGVYIGKNKYADVTVSVGKWYTVSTVLDFLSIGYEVADAGDGKYTLTATKANLSKNYKLMNDLDFAEFCSKNYYTPIAAFGTVWKDTADMYSGIFDGQGHSIKNISNTRNCVRPSDNDQGIGLFGIVSGTVKNLNVVNMTLDANAYTAPIAHGSFGATFENIYISVKFTKATGNRNAGIFSQEGAGKTTIKNVVVDFLDTAAMADTNLHPVTAWMNQQNTVIENVYVIWEARKADKSIAKANGVTLTNCHISGYGEGYYAELKELGIDLDDPRFDFFNRLRLTSQDVEFYVGDLADLPIVNLSSKEITVTPADAKVIYKEGKLSATEECETTVTVTLTVNDKEYSVTFNVVATELTYTLDIDNTPVTSILSAEGKYEGKNLTYTATVNSALSGEEDATSEIAWTTSNDKVATVEAGVVTVVGNGAATITATLGSLSESFVVTVFSPVYDVVSFMSMGYEVVDAGEGVYTLTATKANLAKNYMLINDIDFAEFCEKNYYTPIAAFNATWAASEAYSGIFDGQEFALKNINKTRNCVRSGSNDSGVGLFGMVSGTVRNLNIINMVLDAAQYNAPIAHGLFGAHIENVYASVKFNRASGTRNGGVFAQSGSAGNVIKNVVIDLLDTASIADANLHPIAAYMSHSAGQVENVFVIWKNGPDSISAINGLTAKNCAISKTGAEFGSVFDTLTQKFPRIRLTASNVEFYAGEKVDLPIVNLTAKELTVTPADAKVSYAEGKLSATEPCETTVTVSVKVNNVDYSVTFDVVVKTDPYVLEMATNDVYSILAVEGKFAGKDLTYTTTVTKATKGQADLTDEIAWTTSNDKVATVDAGVVTVVGNGIATITATLGDVEKSFKVNVYSPVYDADSFKAIDTDATSRKGLYALVNDIDFDGVDYSPICAWSSSTNTVDYMFSGIFDGRGYALKNLTINHNAKANGNAQLGVFGQLNNGTIRNLNILDVSVSASTYSGLVAHYSQGTSLIENVFVRGSFNGTGGNNGFIVAQSISSGANYTTLKNVIVVATNNGTVESTNVLPFLAYRTHRVNAYDCYVVCGDLAGNAKIMALSGATFTRCAAVASAEVSALYDVIDATKFDAEIWNFDGEKNNYPSIIQQ